MKRAILLVLLFAAQLAAGQSSIPAGARFVMSHFKSNTSGGDERLFISTSPDGLMWTALNGGNPVWQPVNWAPFNNVVRDPTIIYDHGLYWVAFTSGNYGHHASFGLVNSSDLLNWNYVGEISTALAGATDPLTWNPCFFRDGDGSVHVLVSISPINGSNYNPIPAMQSYELHPVSADWTQWSTPTLAGLPGMNTNELWVWKEGGVYHGIYVDFQQNGAQVHATSNTLIGGWQNPKTLGFGSQEGGQILKKPSGGYRLYLEPGNIGQPQATYRYSDCDATFSNFTAQQSVQSSVGMRNGKMTAAPGTTAFATWVSANLGSMPAAMQTAGADPDGDGLPNLLEYAFDSDPLTPSVSQAPLGAFAAQFSGETGFTLTFREIPRLSDVTYTVEASSDLQNWSSDANSVQIQSMTLQTDGSLQTVALALAAPGMAAANYLRVAVTLAAEAPAAPALAPSVKKASVKRAPQKAGRAARD